ncbi:MAG: hypothetical protein ACXIVQ_09020 [Acidimicrobiales bacterium]
MSTSETLLVKDTRGRVTIGGLSDADRFIVYRDPSGRIVLEPAVVMTATEARLLGDPGFVRRMSDAATAPTEPLDFDDL